MPHDGIQLASSYFSYVVSNYISYKVQLEGGDWRVLQLKSRGVIFIVSQGSKHSNKAITHININCNIEKCMRVHVEVAKANFGN